MFSEFVENNPRTLQIELKEAYGNASSASYALDPPGQGQISFQDDDSSSSGGGDGRDPANRGPSSLNLSVHPGQARVQVLRSLDIALEPKPQNLN